MTHENPIIEANGAKELRALLAKLDDLADPENRAICRGQSIASWRLQSSLDRDVKPNITYDKRLDEERCLVERFRRCAEHLLGANPHFSPRE